jgi:ribosomal protein S18 acetylase RimI-like enzyme
VEALAALCVEHAAFEGVTLEREPGRDALHAALFGAAAPLICWVAERAGRILGYATATREFSTWQAAYYLHMDCLYLKPEGRNGGVGEALVRQLAGDALRLECRGMQWQTPATNLRAAGFYRRIGAQSKDKLRFYLPGPEMQMLARHIMQESWLEQGV